MKAQAAAMRRRLGGLTAPLVSTKPRRTGTFVLGVAIVGAFPWLLTSFWQSLLVDTLLAVLLALGLNVVVGFAGLLDLGYVAFYAIGHYAYAIPTASSFSKAIILRQGVNVPPFPAWHDWMWLLFFLAVAAAMVSGIVLGGPTLRLRGDYLAIVTLGFGEIVRLAATNFDTITLGSRGITQVPHPSLDVGPLVHYKFGLDWQGYYYLLLLMTLIMIGVIVRLNNSRIGRAWHAIREDEVAAAAMGVPTVRMKLWAFAIGASTAGLAGAVQASRINFVSPDDFTLLVSIFILCMVVLGGMGSIAGSILGAAVITIVPEFIRTRAQSFQEYRFLVFGAIIVIMMIYRPQGLIPSKRRAIELTGGIEMPGKTTIDMPQAGAAGYAPAGESDGAP